MKVQQLLRRKRAQKGFTLVEVIVVLVILAILAALLIPSMVKWIDKSRWAEAESRMNLVRKAVVSTAVEAYASDKFTPADIKDRTVDVVNGEGTLVSPPGALQDYFVSHLKEYLGEDLTLKDFWVWGQYNQDGTVYSLDIFYYLKGSNNPLPALHYHEDASGSALTREEA